MIRVRVAGQANDTGQRQRPANAGGTTVDLRRGEGGNPHFRTTVEQQQSDHTELVRKWVPSSSSILF